MDFEIIKVKVTAQDRQLKVIWTFVDDDERLPAKLVLTAKQRNWRTKNE